MKFHVNRDVFSEAVSFVVKLLPQRNPQPILAGVLIEATEDGLSLAAFDYEASARTTIEATVDEPGTILVHGRLLSEIASRTSITWLRSRAIIHGSCASSAA